MKNQRKNAAVLSLCFLAAFVLWTCLLRFVDVKPIGPCESNVGFAKLNGAFHALTGVNMALYHVTDWLGLVPIAVALGFAILGLVQLIKRGKILKVDRSILILGAFYIVVFAVYVLFEFIVVNRRPVLIEGYLEASYPSSTTMLVSCIMPTAAMQLDSRIKDRALRRGVCIAIWAFTLFMVIGRLVSGVHWLTDIIGGSLVSVGLVFGYRALE